MTSGQLDVIFVVAVSMLAGGLIGAAIGYNRGMRRIKSIMKIYSNE